MAGCRAPSSSVTEVTITNSLGGAAPSPVETFGICAGCNARGRTPRFGRQRSANPSAAMRARRSSPGRRRASSEEKAKTQTHPWRQLRGFTEIIPRPKRAQPAAAGRGAESAFSGGGALHGTRCVFTGRTRWDEEGAGRWGGEQGPCCGDGERWGASRRIYERWLSRHDASGAKSRKRRAS